MRATAPAVMRRWRSSRSGSIVAKNSASCSSATSMPTAYDALLIHAWTLSNAVIESMKRNRGLSDREAKDFVVSAHGVVDVFRLYLAACGSAVSEGQVKGRLAGPRNR